MPKQQILQMNQIDYRFFEKARQVAMISDYHKTHVGCVAVYHGNIIGIGCNCNKTHPTQDHYNKYRKKIQFPASKITRRDKLYKSNQKFGY